MARHKVRVHSIIGTIYSPFEQTGQSCAQCDRLAELRGPASCVRWAANVVCWPRTEPSRARIHGWIQLGLDTVSWQIKNNAEVDSISSPTFSFLWVTSSVPLEVGSWPRLQLAGCSWYKSHLVLCMINIQCIQPLRAAGRAGGHKPPASSSL